MASEQMTININSDIRNAEQGINKINKKFGEIGKVVGKFALGAGAALGSFAVGVGIKAVNASKDLDSAVKNLGNQVGASTGEMKEFEGIITNLYKQNIGENFQDIAGMIAEVRKQTQLSGDELKDFTQYAAKFGQVYDQEIVESTRSANMMMKQFGLSSEESFNLMVQGMEKGLNKNDDFLDSINEYSTHFKDLGFDAEEMFELYVKGVESGAWSVDKLGDAIKEFNGLSSEMSDKTIKAFQDLGLQGKETVNLFAEGGENANKAFKDVLSRLGTITDKVKREEIGDALFGEMWKDIGAEIVLSLSDVETKFDKTVDSAERLSAVQYKDLDSMLQAIGRTIEVDLLLPLGNELMPVIEDILKKAKEELPGVIDQFKDWGKAIKKYFEDSGGVEKFWAEIWSLPVEKDQFLGELKTELDNVIKIFKDAYGQISRNIMEKTLPLIAKAYGWGRNLIQSFLTGMFSMFTSIAYVARNAAAIIRSYLGWYSPTEKGPGKDSDEWGPNFVDMFSKGISMNLPALEHSVSMGASGMEKGFGQNVARGSGLSGGTVQLVNANIFNETLLNMLMNRIKKELISGGI